MFDYHMHTKVSFDGIGTAEEMVRAATERGLQEICFTDHMDYHSDPTKYAGQFDIKDYQEAYGHLSHPDLKIRRGIEIGLTRWNCREVSRVLAAYPYDFVIGSLHFADGYDPYDAEYWEGRTVKEAFRLYFEESLACVRLHEDFDVFGHLTYVCKSPNNPTHEPVRFEDFQELTDEIMRELVRKGKGMEVNTSGIDRVGEFLPSAPYLRRFRELGGEIVTLGSDAHAPDRVGQYAEEALDMLRDIFGYVCTFEGRKPIFHKL